MSDLIKVTFRQEREIDGRKRQVFEDRLVPPGARKGGRYRLSGLPGVWEAYTIHGSAA